MQFPADIPAVPIDVPRPRSRTIMRDASVWALVLLVVGASLFAGLQLRRWTWEVTAPIRFTSDIERGYGWGREAAERGYFNLYEKMSPQQPKWDNWLDYAPLRLAVMTGWGHWTKSHYPEATKWQPDWAFNRPVLLFNTFMEFVAAVCAFMVTRLWVSRAAPTPRPFAGWLAGLAAGLLLWFNPAIVLSAHGWPTWDMWVIPMYLLAVLLASHDRWFAAGLAVAFGAMFKGQQLAVAPLFLIWPLVMLRFDAMLKWAVGLVLGVGLLASPWLLTYVPPEALAAAQTTQLALPNPWDVAKITLPSRIADTPGIVWVAGVLIATIGGPIVMARLRRRRRELHSAVDTMPPSPPSLPMVPSPLSPSSPSSAFTDDNGGVSPPNGESDTSDAGGAVTSGAGDVAVRPGRPWLSARRWPSPVAMAVVALAVALLVGWPWLLGRNRADRTEWTFGVAFVVVTIIAILVVRPRRAWLVAAGALGASLLLCQVLFSGSEAWWICGWKFGTVHWPGMTMGMTSNLPGILQRRYGWQSPQLPVEIYQIPADLLFGYPKAAITFTIKQLLSTLFVVTLVLSAVGVGLHARRRDRRILVALAAPWLMFFCFPVQIHERYLLFAAGVGTIAVGAGVGPALLCVFLGAVTWVMTIHVMLNQGRVDAFGQGLATRYPDLFAPDFGHTLHAFVRGTHPDVGWAVLLCAGVFLYLSLVPSRRRVVEEED